MLALERLFNDRFTVEIKKNSIAFYLKMLFIFLAVTLAWLLFRLPNFEEAVMYVKACFQNTGMVNNYVSIFLISLYSLPVILYHLVYLKRRSSPAFLVKQEYVIYGAMIFLIITNSGTPGSFIYFQF
jgi:alginate O-acetyltransferase complex protein AlgI